MKKKYLIIQLMFLLSGLFAQTTTIKKQRVLPQGEFRAVWIATVNNMDWPSQPGLSAQAQMKEAIHILDLAVTMKLNAIIFQVRPHCDALYNSTLEPWSYYLQGKQGVSPNYDPLQFWIQEAHKRGLELHAWFNPFRLRHPKMKGEYSEKCIAVKKPSWGYKLKNGYSWLDPAKSEVQDYTIQVIMDVVKRYDLDGVHIDDYFYPYPEYMENGIFPDQATYASYQKNGGKLALADWRRDSINRFVVKLSTAVRNSGKLLRFGISPFGIWRPNHPPGIKGMDPYEQLYADSKKWMQDGLVDYMAPQIYWSTNSTDQNFTKILDWWRSQNSAKCHIYPGLAVYKATDWEDGANQLLKQIQVVQQRPDVQGFIHFNMRPILDNPQLFKPLVHGMKSGALTPPLKMSGFNVNAENISYNNGILTWQCRSPLVRKWIIFAGDTPILYLGGTRSADLRKMNKVDSLSILPIGPAGVPGIMLSVPLR